MKMCEYRVVIRAFIALRTDEYDFDKAKKKLKTMGNADVLAAITRVEDVHINNHKRFKS